MAEGCVGEQTECSMAIERVSRKISQKFPQYPEFADKFKIHCREEAFEETDVLIDDVSEGFDESVILEAIAEDIDIIDDDKEALCRTIHNLLSTFVPPLPEPSSLNLMQILYTNSTDNEINRMKKLVSSQVKLLETNNKDISIYAVLSIGQKNNFPLLTYLVCSYQRYRLSMYFQYKTIYDNSHDDMHNNKPHKNQMLFDDVKLTQFMDDCNTMIEMKLNAQNDMLLSYSNAMRSCIHRNGIFYALPLIESQITNKINDSLAIFQIYFLSFFLCVNEMIKDLLISYPTQIDIWIIPNNITQDNDAFVDDMNNEFTLHQGLKYCHNLQQVNIQHDKDLNIEKLIFIFKDIIQKVLAQRNHKRMCMIIDRRNESKSDILYAYLPPNTSDIGVRDTKNEFLYESMVNLTKKEMFPLSGDITINANSDLVNMFVISSHIHRENEIAMYWHYKGSTTRFYINDMIALWPLHFIVNENEMENINHQNELVRQYILRGSFDELCDLNFSKFYEINTGYQWYDTICPLFSAKPKTIKPRRDSNEEMEEKIQQYKKRQEAEASYKKRKQLLYKNAMLKRAKSANIIKENCKMKQNKKNKLNEGDIKMNDDVLKQKLNEFKLNENKQAEIRFIYASDFDTNGLLYFLGTYAKRKRYTNPGLIPIITVNASSLANDSRGIYTFVGRECVRCITDNSNPSSTWMSINIHPVYIKLTSYTLKHHNSHNAALLNWTLEGSNDGNQWMILKNHIFDESLSTPNDTHTWHVNTNHYFKHFRIFMTDKNNSGRWYLGCSGIELYGDAFGGLVSESQNEDFDEKLQLQLTDDELLDEHQNYNKKDLFLSTDHLKIDKQNRPSLKNSKTWNHLFKKSPKTSPKSSLHVMKFKWNIYAKEEKKCLQNMFASSVCVTTNNYFYFFTFIYYF